MLPRQGWRMAKGQLGDSNVCAGLLQRVHEGCQGCTVPCLDSLNVEHLLHPQG